MEFHVYFIHAFAHTVSISEASIGTDYTGEIHSFSEIGPGGLPVDVPIRPWGL